MNPLDRPREPPAWLSLVADIRRTIASLDRNPEEKDFEKKWQDFVREWERAQHQLCGYCSTKLRGSLGHIDHYRPKTKCTRVVLERGKEVEGTQRINGRKLRPKPGFMPAWPQHAYDWDNYVYACERCNVGWKRTLFPAVDVSTGQRVTTPPGPGEQALLLNPFEREEPSDHFAFDERGSIRGTSDRGTATIEVCGLDRHSLMRDRAKLVDQRINLLDDLARAGVPSRERRRTVRRAVRLGQWNEEHAGMWRDLVRGRGHDWQTLELEAAYTAAPRA